MSVFQEEKQKGNSREDYSHFVCTFVPHYVLTGIYVFLELGGFHEP